MFCRWYPFGHLLTFSTGRNRIADWISQRVTPECFTMETLRITEWYQYPDNMIMMDDNHCMHRENLSIKITLCEY